MNGRLHGQVALVTGATRGAGRGMAAELGAAGATVYVTGRSTRASLSPLNRPETIEDTAPGSSGNRSGSTTWTRACVRCATAWRRI